MDDDKKPALPGNHGQFGTDIETEAYERLGDPPPAPPASGADAGGGAVDPGAQP